MRGGAARRQHLHALGVFLFLVQHRGRFSEGGFRVLEIDFEGPGIELVKNVARFDVAALFEIAADDDAGHAGAHLGDPCRRNAAGQFADHGERHGLQLDDADFRDRGDMLTARSGGTFPAAGEHP